MPTAFEWLDRLVSSQAISQSRAKDVRTAIRRLADAAGVAVDALDMPQLEASYARILETYFSEQSPPLSHHTQRNTQQNLKQFYRLLGETFFVAPRVPRRPPKGASQTDSRNEADLMSPYRDRMMLPKYRRWPEQWPEGIRDPWQRYCAERAFDIRPISLGTYEAKLAAYLGWGLTMDSPPMATWDDLFDVRRLQRFLAWHAKRVGARRVSQTGLHVVSVIMILAHHYHRPEYPSVQAFEEKLPVAEPMHNKQAPMHQVSAKELEAVALSLLAEARLPYAHPNPPAHNQHPGLKRACRHQSALLIRLMWRIPLRSRCLCEMLLGKNLYQSNEGQWFLRYEGEELKVSERNGRSNIFHVPWPKELTEHLEEYLRDFRPCFPHAAENPHVFLSVRGRQMTKENLALRLSVPVYHRLKKRLYPHLLRTLWVDQYLLASNGDVSTAAYLLNDRPTTVLKRYHELRGADHIQKAYAFNEVILGNGKASEKAYKG